MKGNGVPLGRHREEGGCRAQGGGGREGTESLAGSEPQRGGARRGAGGEAAGAHSCLPPPILDTPRLPAP